MKYILATLSILFCIHFFSLSCIDHQPRESKKIIKTETSKTDSSLQFTLNKNEQIKATRIDSYYVALSEQSKFNGVVLIAQNHRILYRKAFGWKNYKEKLPLQINTKFELASASKQFTAVAIMLLKEQGLIDYKDPVIKFFPDFPYNRITIKQLLTHRSGLPDYFNFCNSYCKKPKDTVISNMDVVRLMVSFRPKEFNSPDKCFYYNNTNYMLLAAIVEKVSNMSFPEFMKIKVFSPLGIKNTYVKDKSSFTYDDEEAIGYEDTFREYGFDMYDGCYGDKGVFSTIEDMYKWDEMLNSEQLLKQETLKEAFTPHSFEKKGKKNYGYGFRLISEEDSVGIVYHNGWWHGYRSVFYKRLADKTTIIALSNTTNESVYFIKPVLEILSSGNNIIADEGER